MIQVTALIGLPLLLSIFFTIRAKRWLDHDSLLGLSPVLVSVFTITRALYWWSFGILILALGLGLMVTGASGESARSLLLFSKSTSGMPDWLMPISHVLEYWRFLIVLVSLVMILAAVGALFLMGRRALKEMPEDEEPSAEFLRARARFFFLGLTLIAPPLVLAILLSI